MIDVDEGIMGTNDVLLSSILLLNKRVGGVEAKADAKKREVK